MRSAAPRKNDSHDDRQHRAAHIATARRMCRQRGIPVHPRAEPQFRRYIEGEITFEQLQAAIAKLGN